MKTKTLALAIAALACAIPAPLAAQATNFTLVNNTDISFTGLMARRFGTQSWAPRPPDLGSGSGATVSGAVAFTNPDCAFDLQATLPDGRMVVWSGVNLCDAKVVTLNRGPGGELWVDYD